MQINSPDTEYYSLPFPSAGNRIELERTAASSESLQIYNGENRINADAGI